MRAHLHLFVADSSRDGLFLSYLGHLLTQLSDIANMWNSLWTES